MPVANSQGELLPQMNLGRTQLIYNNLGGMGPNTDDPPQMRFDNIGNVDLDFITQTMQWFKDQKLLPDCYALQIVSARARSRPPAPADR